jgi:hypothetical protein
MAVPIGPQGLSYGGTHRDVTIPIPFGIGGIGIDPPSQKLNYKILKNRLQIQIP